LAYEVLAAALNHDSCFVVGSHLNRTYVSVNFVYHYHLIDSCICRWICGPGTKVTKWDAIFELIMDASAFAVEVCPGCHLVSLQHLPGHGGGLVEF